MVGTGTDDSDIDPVFLVPTGVSVDNIDSIPSVEVIYGSFTIDLPYLRENRYQSARSGAKTQ
jgi:hypothetical protein